MFEQFVGGHVVMGGVQADICEHDSGFMPAKRVDGIEEVDAVVAFRAGEVHQQWEVDLEFAIVGAEHVKCAPEIIPA